jgi:Concanavalin A-like lectin/glucanases superfamily
MIRARLIAMRAVVLVAIAGCSFSPQNASAPVDAQGSIDAGSTMMIDAPAHGSGSGSGTGSGSGSGSGSSGGGSAAPCYAPDQTQLELCLELDDADLVSDKTAATALDGGPGHHDAAVTNSDVATRTVPTTSQAETMLVSEESTPTDIIVPSSTDFDLQQFTIMMWVDPTSTAPNMATWALVEKADQYLVGLDDDGNLFCEVEGKSGDIASSVGDNVPLNTWSLVACSYSGSSLCVLVLTGASGGNAQLHCENGASDMLGSGSVGLAVGSRFDGTTTYDHVVGAVDSVRIFSRVLSQQDICNGGGRSGC